MQREKKLLKENSELCSKVIELEENIEFLSERLEILKKRIRDLERKNTELTKELKEKGCNNGKILLCDNTCQCKVRQKNKR